MTSSLGSRWLSLMMHAHPTMSETAWASKLGAVVCSVLKIELNTDSPTNLPGKCTLWLCEQLTGPSKSRSYRRPKVLRLRSPFTYPAMANELTVFACTRSPCLGSASMPPKKRGILPPCHRNTNKKIRTLTCNEGESHESRHPCSTCSLGLLLSVRHIVNIRTATHRHITLTLASVGAKADGTSDDTAAV